MTENNWILNLEAVSLAKECIFSLKNEFGIRVKLSDPAFFDLLDEYSQLSESDDFKITFRQLANLVKYRPKSDQEKRARFSNKRTELNPTPAQRSDNEVAYHGKNYPRFNSEGKEFKGLYRGQARYA